MCPSLARAVLIRIADKTENIEQQFPLTDRNFIQGVIDSVGARRSDREAIAECFARHESGDCPESLLYKYITIDDNFV